jgi:formylglycine-generating enzyme required for sulfatase activity
MERGGGRTRVLLGLLLFGGGIAAGAAGALLFRQQAPPPAPAIAPAPAPAAAAPARVRPKSPVLVLVDPPGASVAVDGGDRGIAGPDGLLLEDLDPAASHAVRASLEGSEPVEAALAPREAGGLRVLRLALAVPMAEVLLRDGRAGTTVVAVRAGRPPRDIAIPADGDLGPLPVEAGDYELTLSRAGSETRRESVHAAAGSVVEVDAALPEKAGALTLDSDPRGAAVSLDDQPLGTAPLAAVPVSPGPHQLRLVHPDADDLLREVTIRGEALEDLGVLRLPPLAVLDLTGLPDGVRASVDGRPAGGKLRRKPGPLVVTLSREGSMDQETTVQLQSGREARPAVAKWSDVPGILDLSRVPADTTVRVDGREPARGPDGRVRVAPGKVRLSLDGPGLGTVVVSEVAVEPGGTVEIPAPAWKPRSLRPAVPGLPSPPRPDRGGALLPPGLVEVGGRILGVRDGAEAALVPSGEFTMGADEGEKPERPARKVLLSAFLMDRHEVVNAQFAEFAAATGFVTDAERSGSAVNGDGKKAAGLDWRHPGGPGSSLEGLELHPAVFVSWNDAQAYAAWAGRHLPTEAEFERALRGGIEGRRYPWGDEAPPRSRVANLLDESALAAHPKWKGALRGYRDGFPDTAPAGTFPANPFGLYDICGNCSEWCRDGYDANYYAAGPRGNPPGPDLSACRNRMVRGGGFATAEKNLRCANRAWQLPGAALPWLGFRCAADLVPSKER